MNIISLSILMDAFFIGLLVWCSYTDIRWRTVSNIAIALLLCLGIAHTGFMAFTQITWWHYPAGLVYSLPFFVSWHKNKMGAGDVKLIMAISLYLGLYNSIFAFFIMLLGLILWSIYARAKLKNTKTRIPLAPFISAGAIVFLALQYFIF